MQTHTELKWLQESRERGRTLYIGREKELQTLADCYAKDGFQMVRISGRLRSGRTSLVRHFLTENGYRGLWYQTAGINPADDIAALSESVSGAGDTFRTIQSALNAVFLQSLQDRVVLVIDDYRRILDSTPNLTQDIEELIQVYRESCHLMMIIIDDNCDGLFDSENPQDIVLREWDMKQSSKMLSSFSPEDRVILYGILGGVPGHFVQLNPNLSARENILTKIAAPGSELYCEVERHLSEIMRETRLYNSLLYAISRGAVRMRDIVAMAGQPSATVNIYLNRMLEMGVVRKDYPFGEDPKTSRHTRYCIPDRLMAFYFYNYRAIRLGQPQLVEQGLNAYLEPVFCQLCQEYLRTRLGGENGAWWNRDTKMPIAGHADGRSYAGMSRWTGKQGDVEDLEDLKKAGRKMPEDNTCYYLFVRPGYTKECQEKVKTLNHTFELVDFHEMMEELS